MEHGASLNLNRCPHCNVAKPLLVSVARHNSANDRDGNTRHWAFYECATCGGVTMAVAARRDVPGGSAVLGPITEIWPASQHVDDAVPQRARMFLEQAIASVHAPAGAVMLSASAVDAMLKEKGLKDGNLYRRIGEAAEKHFITAEMAQWAHEVRLEANDQRHADEEAALPDEADARRVIRFALALAQFLFVLPDQIARGRDGK